MKKIFLLFCLVLLLGGCQDTGKKQEVISSKVLNIEVNTGNSSTKQNVITIKENSTEQSTVQPERNLKLGTVVKLGTIQTVVASKTITFDTINVPVFTSFNVSSNVKFNVQTLSLVDAQGAINIDVYYNNVAELNLNKVYVKVSMPNGFKGTVVTNNAVPLEVKVGTTYYQLSSPVVVAEWNKPFTDVLKQNIVVTLRGDFTSSIAQTYSGNILFELVKDLN
jgi:hypothetical protein